MKKPFTGNPNHPVTQKMSTEWHKFCMLIMLKYGVDTVEITAEDVLKMAESDKAIVCDTRGGKLVLCLVSNAEGERIAREEGGLPA